VKYITNHKWDCITKNIPRASAADAGWLRMLGENGRANVQAGRLAASLSLACRSLTSFSPAKTIGIFYRAWELTNKHALLVQSCAK